MRAGRPNRNSKLDSPEEPVVQIDDKDVFTFSPKQERPVDYWGPIAPLSLVGFELIFFARQ